MMIISFIALIVLFLPAVGIIEKRYKDQPGRGTSRGLSVICLFFAGIALALAITNGIAGFSLVFCIALILTAAISAYQDIRYQEIENEIPLLMIIISVIYLLAGHKSLLDSLSGLMIGGGFLLLVAVLTKGGMGGADIKLMAAYGLFLGIKPVMEAMFIAFCLGAVLGLILMVLGVVKRKQYIPFSPYLSMGTIIAYLYGDKLLNIYFNSLVR